MDPFAEEQVGSGSAFDPLQLLRMFWRRKWLFIIPFVLCLAMAGVAIQVQTPIYFSVAQIRVIHDTSSASTLPHDVSRYAYGRNLDKEAIVNIETIITGPKFLESVVRELGLHRAEMSGAAVLDTTTGGQDISAEVEQAVRRAANRLGEQVRVRHDGTYLFGIGVRDTDPRRAHRLTSVVLDLFLEAERASRLQPSTSTREFLEERRKLQQQKLTDTENRLNQFRRSMLSASLAGNPVNERNLLACESALSRLRSQYQEMESTELAYQERQAQAALGRLPDLRPYAQDSEIATAVRDLTGLEFDDLIAATAMIGGMALQNDMGLLRLRLNSLIEAKVARDFPQLGVMQRNRVAQYVYTRLYRDVRNRVMTRLEQNISEFRNFTTRQPEQSEVLNSLLQEVEAARDLLLRIERDISQEDMRQAASLSEIGYRIEVRRDPSYPMAPIEPNKVKLAFMGFVLSLGMGGGLVLLVQLLDRSFHSVEGIEQKLGVRVIGTLPVIDDSQFENLRSRRIWIWIVLVLAVLVIAAAGFLYVYPRLS